MEDMEAGLLTECCDLLNNISTYPENKKCFDCCDNYSPRYLCTTFSTFVCSCCANIHQEFGHSVKVLSIFSFTLSEIYVLKETGNRVAADKWLSRWRPDLFKEPDPTSSSYKHDARKYIKAKYIEKRWVKLPPPLPEIKPAEGETEPRGYEDVSPRKVGDVVSPGSTLIQQHEDKVPVQPLVRDNPFTGAPSIMYVPQPMYIPVSLSQMTMAMPNVPQYAYPQYLPQSDVTQMNQLTHQQSYYGPLYTYPFDNMHCLPPPILQDGVSWPGALTKKKKKRPTTTAMHPQRDLTSPQPFASAEELPAAPPGAILRSVSDNSIVTTYVLQIPNHKKESMPNGINCNTSSATVTKNATENRTEVKISIEPSVTKADLKNSSGKSDSKRKLSGIMSKVVGLLGKKS